MDKKKGGAMSVMTVEANDTTLNHLLAIDTR